MVFQAVVDRVEKGLRPLNPARDLPQLADLIEDAFGAELSGEGERVLREIRFLGMLGPLNLFITGAQTEETDIFTGLVWVQDGKIVGNVTVNRPTGHPRRWQISNVAVHSSYRRQGIARKLVEAAIEMVLYRGGSVAYLYVRDDNMPARHLYQSLGFVEVDRTTDLALTRLVPRRDAAPVCLRPLTLQESDRLYRLVLDADGRGRQWLYPPHRGQYVFSKGELFFRRLESWLAGKVETRWGAFSGAELDAGVILNTTFGLNTRAHRLKLWTRADCPDRVRDAVAQDILSILAARGLAVGARRPVHVSLPLREFRVIEALLQRGFDKRRTLILTRLNL